MMRPKFLRVPSPAMIVACIALAVALSGASYAAIVLPKNSVGTKQLRKNAVTSAKVKNDAITGAKVNEATLGTVPSAGSAANSANADRLDGVDSAAFLRNSAPLALSRAEGTVIEGTNSGSGGIGVAGRSNGSNGTGVFGEATGPNGRAGAFSGKVQIDGGLNVDGPLTLSGNPPNFVSGGKAIRNARAITPDPDPAAYYRVLQEPNFFDVFYTCPIPVSNNGTVLLSNLTGEPVNVFFDNGGASPVYLSLGINGYTEQPAFAGGEWYTFQIHSPSKGIATISLFTVHRASDCHAQAQALITN